MFILAMKRIVVFALAIFAFFTAAAGKGQPDSFEAYDFPIYADLKFSTGC
ncbi:MAG: hypothetical protein IJK02_12570 [Clostridia bacterium]|nr:hypothetical protein [Clostridia bacterium]